MTAPTLPPGCGSWIVVRKDTLDAVYETGSRSVAEKVNAERYTVLTALDYLQRLTITPKSDAARGVAIVIDCHRLSSPKMALQSYSDRVCASRIVILSSRKKSYLLPPYRGAFIPV